MKRIGHLLSYPNVVSTLALVIATSGGAYAVSQLPAGSVGTSQLQNSAVTAPKLHGDAVTGAKVKNGSLAAADFAAGQLPNSGSGGKMAPGVVLQQCATTVVATRTVTPKRAARMVALASGSWSTGGSLAAGQGIQVLAQIRVTDSTGVVGMTGSTEFWGQSTDGVDQLPFSFGSEVLAYDSTPTVLNKGVTYTIQLRFLLGGDTCSAANDPAIGNAVLTTILTDNAG